MFHAHGSMEAVFALLWISNTLVTSSQAVTIDLTGKWTVSNHAKGIQIAGDVPGSMYTAMHSNKLITDPRYRDNDVKLRWIALDDWTYTRTVNIPPDVLQLGSIHLVCEGLDTISTVYINNHPVGTSDNMFLKYDFDVKDALKVGSNMIRVEFQSAVRVAGERANASSYEIPGRCPALQHGECHSNWIRKPAYSFSWDGGPCFPTQGIWKNIHIRAFSTAVIDEFAISVRKQNSSSGKGWVLDMTVTFKVGGERVAGQLDIQLVKTHASSSLPLVLTPSNTTVLHSLVVDDKVDLWWPSRYGNQTLYTVNVTFTDMKNTEVSNKQRRIGFRTVELVQDPLKHNQGSTFYYKINGLPIFLKGASLMPIDSFLENATRERYRRLLVSAHEANMNVIRLNGHGIYESDDFYRLADELGIMVWQDFMFSLSLYPVTPDFLSSVKKEVTYQLRRLKHHPSIIQWAGNNECETGISQNWFKVPDVKRYYPDYVKLYVDTIKPIKEAEDGTREFVTSCPSNGREDEMEGWIPKNPQSELYGDIHYYNYISDMWEVSSYKIPRIATEYGLQAWSGIEDLEDVLLPEDFNFTGDMAQHREHHPDGLAQLLYEVKQHFRTPTTNDTQQFFKDMVYLTQVNQAVGVSLESQHFRRWQSEIGEDGRGQTMGCIFWQLHSLWQAPTWSSIDFNLKWRMLHYYARKFFAPTLISPYWKEDELSIYLVVDGIALSEVKDDRTGVHQLKPARYFPQEVSHLKNRTLSALSGVLYIQGFCWNSFTPFQTWSIPYKLNKSSEVVLTHPWEWWMTKSTCPDQNSVFLHMFLNSEDSGITADVPFSYYKDATGLSKANVQIAGIKQISATEAVIKLTSDKIALFVWVDAYRIPGRFSDNGFLMMKPSWNVTFTSWDPLNLDLLKKSLTVKSLMDIYE